MSGVKDKHIAVHCKESKFVLITLDKDFFHTSVYPPKDYEGIIVLRPKSQGLFSVMKLFTRFLQRFDLKKVKHKTIIVEDKYIKIRQ